MDHQKSISLLISDTLSVRGCWGQPMLVFENWLMKHKFPHLLKPLGTIIQQNYWSFYPSEPFSLDQFNMIHPVLARTNVGIWDKALCKVGTVVEHTFFFCSLKNGFIPKIFNCIELLCKRWFITFFAKFFTFAVENQHFTNISHQVR